MAIECQDCHMYPDSVSTYFVYPEKGGLHRNPLSIPSHLQPGSRDPKILANSVTMKVAVVQPGDSIRVMVTIYNDKTGHHVPTGRPSRNMLLLVDAITAAGTDLELIAGETVPDWGGTGNYSDGNFAGYAGKGFAKILEDIGKVSPAPSWRPTHIIADNRIATFATDTSYYYFKSPATSEIVTIKARLIYRRFFKSWMDEKKFDIPDIEMENELVEFTTIPLNREKNSTHTPDAFRLAQNYPNPFNASTTIKFQIPPNGVLRTNSEITTLKVYNVLGEEVATLVTKKLNQGNHIYHFNGSDLVSGIYYYKLVAGKFREVKKMILLK